MIRCVACLVTAVVMAGIAGCGREDILPRSEQTVEGVTVYLGIVPAALIQGHSTTPGDPQSLHGGTPSRSASHHVMVALFDAVTGARITDARVEARVEGVPHAKPLEQMEVNGLMTYGNFFPFEDARVRRIRVEIALPDRAAPLVAQFAYDHEPAT
ncbi:MAG TPA: hypothetical protein VFS23_33995 [Vicinamibacterales bacterium]|nr:hypothetical protein [Vicinamibacterales bacterium]